MITHIHLSNLADQLKVTNFHTKNKHLQQKPNFIFYYYKPQTNKQYYYRDYQTDITNLLFTTTNIYTNFINTY